MRQRDIAYNIGSVLILAGLFSGRLLVIRPNRIESGVGLDALTAFGSGPDFWAVSFLIISALLLTLFFRHFPHPGVFVSLPCLMLLTLTGAIASAADSVLAGTDGLARASLGAGFWLMFAGILLMIQGSLKALKTRVELKALMLFCCLSACFAGMYAAGWLDSIAVVKEISSRSGAFAAELARHLHLTLAAVITGLILSLAFSYWAYRRPGLKKFVTAVANGAQVIPTLSLLGMLMVPLAALALRYPGLKELGISGIGFFPAYIALMLYTLLPITASSLAGFNSIDPDILLSAKGMGMSRLQILARIELPLALPAILSGFRTALVQTVGNCILAGMVAGGGLGSILFLGLAQSAPDLVVASSLAVVFLAFFLNMLMAIIEPAIGRRYGGGALSA